MRPAAHRPRPRIAASPFEALALTGLAVALAAGALVYLTGQLTALAHSGQWLTTTPAEVGAVLARLLAEPADPAAAWPPPDDSRIPGAAAFWTTFATLGSAAGWLAHRAARRWRRDPPPEPARWARTADLKPLLVRNPTGGRVTLGRHHRRLVAAEAGQSVAVIGPTQSGKTTRLAIPAILEWQGPVIATSVKTDLLRDTLQHRQQRGQVWIYDPAATTGLPRASWTPLATCDSWHGALRTAAWLTRTARPTGNGLADSDFWYASAAKLLAPLLYAAARDHRTISEIVRWVDLQDETEPAAILHRAGTPEALAAAAATWQREPRQKSSIYTTAETVLAAYADPTVAATLESCDIDAAQLLDGGHHTLYICAPADEQHRLNALFVTLLETVIAEATHRAHQNGRPLHPPLLIVLDEAANIAALPDLDALASTAAGHGIQLITIWQDLAQMRHRYGDRAYTLLNNHRATVLLRGIKDADTLAHASQLIGEAEITRTTISTDPEGRPSRTDGPVRQRLMPDHRVRSLGQNEALLVYGAMPPTRVTLAPPTQRRGGWG